MDTTQIKNLLVNEPKFGGVLPFDFLYKCTKNKFYIINTDISTEPGKHWLAVYLSDTPEVFDSLGNKPSFYGRDLEYLLVNNGPSYMYNTLRLQADGTDVCGQYCIYYVIMRTFGFTFRNVINSFTNNKLCNDTFVDNFVKRLN
jgi:hypothetical protein